MPKILIVDDDKKLILLIRGFLEKEKYNVAEAYSGRMALDVIKEGGHGVISVASNIVPREVSSLTNNALRRIYSSAEKWDKYLGPLFKAAFLETNPIPIKYMLSFNGMCKEVYRLPLCEMGAENKKRVEKVMEDFNLMPYS